MSNSLCCDGPWRSYAFYVKLVIAAHLILYQKKKKKSTYMKGRGFLKWMACQDYLITTIFIGMSRILSILSRAVLFYLQLQKLSLIGRALIIFLIDVRHNIGVTNSLIRVVPNWKRLVVGSPWERSSDKKCVSRWIMVKNDLI